MINLKEIAFVLRAKNRLKVLNVLQGKELISKQIEELTGMYKSHANRTLKELVTKNLIVCINPNDRSFKFYKLTQQGKKIIKETNKIKNIY